MKQHLFGAGLRHAHFPHLLQKPETETEFFEIISENFLNTKGNPIKVLDQIREDYPITMHGVSLNLASAQEVNFDYLKKLKSLVERIEPLIVSDHLCWTGHRKNNLHNLLPFPYNDKTLEHLVSKVNIVQDYLKRPILVENLSAYFTVPGNKYTEADFIELLAQRSGCKILLDLNNVYVNSYNQNFDPHEYLDKISPEHIGEIHLAGFSDMGTHYFDTHSKPVSQDVWELYKYKSKDLKQCLTLIEWDEDIPEFMTLDQEVAKAKKAWRKSHES